MHPETDTRATNTEVSDSGSGEGATAGKGESLRVLLLISNLEYGGAQRQVVELANRLNAQGHVAHVCCLSDYAPLGKDLRYHERFHVVPKYLKFDISVVPRVARLARHLNVQILHAFLFDAEITARLAGRLHRDLVVIGSERNADYHVRRLHRSVLGLTRHCFDAIIANSEAGKRFQARSFDVPIDRLFVVHNGVDTNRFTANPAHQLRSSLDIPPHTRIVGMCASFKRQKNHLMFFRVARRVIEQIPEVRFLCVGEQLHRGIGNSNSYHAEMLHALDSMKLEDNILFLGNRDDIVEVNCMCDISILTSHHEGTPNVLLESMACGVPVVATDVSDNSLVVPHQRAGFLVADDDDAAMAGHLIELLSDEPLRCRMGDAAREWVLERFSLDTMVRKTVQVYQTAMRQRCVTHQSERIPMAGQSSEEVA